jgi:hypothetical protein
VGQQPGDQHLVHVEPFAHGGNGGRPEIRDRPPG